MCVTFLVRLLLIIVDDYQTQKRLVTHDLNLIAVTFIIRHIVLPQRRRAGLKIFFLFWFRFYSLLNLYDR